ncbi:SIR2 family protein [Acidobacteriia bacterium AH_259_A11_L15]|nr:SIR2 family protein [Acidobacteriia bacterium AH_259_A11_L15]
MKQILLFLGAGASAVRNYPTVDHFFEHLETPPASGYKTACQELARLIDVAEDTSEAKGWPVYNAEKILGRLEELRTAEELLSRPLRIRLPNVQGDGISPRELTAYLKRELIRLYGRRPSFSMPPPPDTDPLGDIFRLMNERTPEGEPLSVFTTNYDTVVEQFFSEWSWQLAFRPYQPRLCTGFSSDRPGIWNPSVFDEHSKPKECLVHLHKLHGSATWKYRPASLGKKEVVDTGWGEPTGEYDCVLYFGYKSIPEGEPFKVLHDRLKEALLKQVVVVAIGFRFADPYIRETFDFALRANDKLSVISCLRSIPPDGTAVRELMRAFPDRFVLLRNLGGDALAYGGNGFLDTLRMQLEKTD